MSEMFCFNASKQPVVPAVPAWVFAVKTGSGRAKGPADKRVDRPGAGSKRENSE